MVECSAYHPSELTYQIKIAGEKNQPHISDIVAYLARQERFVRRKADQLVVKEAVMQDLYDYVSEHLDTKSITFRIANKEWRAIEEVPQMFESKWIDDVILQEKVENLVQPIVTASEKIYGFEMLARFSKEDGSYYSPTEAFEAAKIRNRMYALDQVCRTAAVRNAAFANKKMFINFIPTSINSPEDCLRSTTELVNELGISPERFVFEVVETEQIDDLDHLKTILAYYHKKGFQSALDNVGAGFSTVEMLEELSPHYLKLDMQYVQGVATDIEKQKIAMKLLSAAQKIAAVPLAVGVEEREDFDWLKFIGYQLFQGYLFGKPAPIAN